MAVASPFANYGKFFNVEYRVNGLWNTLLHQKFGAKMGFTDGRYIVCAETFPAPKLTEGKMMDLTVNKLTIDGGHYVIQHSYLALEGKGIVPHTESFAEAVKQCRDWFTDACAADSNGVIEPWILVAKGSSLGFFRFFSGKGAEVFCYKWDVGELAMCGSLKAGVKITTEKIEGEAHLYDISQDGDWNSVNAALNWLVADAP